MKLNALLKGISIIECNVDFNLEVTYISSDHRKVNKNYIFVAINGSKRNGVDFINFAIENGATVIITQDKKACNENIPYILVENVRNSITRMWSNFYYNPEKSLKVVAITGTNGKTSSAYYLYNIIRSAGFSCGLISTIDCLINDKKIDLKKDGVVSDENSNMTTPDPEVLFYILNLMRNSDIKFAIMEASSHALEQNRLGGIEIEIGAFTNLSNEHLDYHKSMGEYFKAKEKLMEMSKTCVINADDEYGDRILKKYPNKSFSFSLNNKGNFYASECNCNLNGCEYKLNYNGKSINIKTSMLGKFNIYNSLLAASCAKLLNIEDDYIVDGIQNMLQIKGRMERYKDKNIYIDYAHTPDAMKKAIMLLRDLEPNKKIISLFGCGGDRDKSKRAKMGRISTSYANFTVITSDNSRSENVNEIISNILKGIVVKDNYIVIPNRREAIIYTVNIMKEDEILLLLGKGHEEYEITSKGKLHFDEREILDEVFQYW